MKNKNASQVETKKAVKLNLTDIKKKSECENVVRGKFKRYKKKNVVYVNPDGVEFTKSDMDDLTNMGLLQNGDKSAFTAIYKKYYKLILYKLIYSLRCDMEVAEDITMDIFEKLYINVGKYQPSYTFNAWLSTISRNCLIDYVRKNKYARHNISLDKTFSVANDDGFEVTFQIQSPILNPEQIMISKNGIDIIGEIVNRLKPDYQILYKLRYLEQVSYEDMHSKTGMSIAKIKIDLFRLRQILIYNLKKLNLAEGFDANQLGSNEETNISSKKCVETSGAKKPSINILEMA
mgnify:FL=1